MSNFFDDDDDYRSDEDDRLDLVEGVCEHLVIVDGYCEICGKQIMERGNLVNEDISVDDAITAKKTVISNEHLLSMAEQLPIPREARQIIINAIRTHPIQAKGGEDMSIKLLCVYAYNTILSTGYLDCTPDRLFQVCGLCPLGSGVISQDNVKKIFEYIKLFRKGKTLQCSSEYYISPINYIKEFLYSVWLFLVKTYVPEEGKVVPIWLQDIDRVRNFANIPTRYVIPPGHHDIVLYAIAMFESDPIRKRQLRHDLVRLVKSEPGPEQTREYLELIGQWEVRESERIARLRDKISNNGYKSDEESDGEYEIYFFNKPAKTAAAVLANVLQFSLAQADKIGEHNIILKRVMGVPEPRMYNHNDIKKYFDLSDSALTSTINRGVLVRVMNNAVKGRV